MYMRWRESRSHLKSETPVKKIKPNYDTNYARSAVFTTEIPSENQSSILQTLENLEQTNFTIEVNSNISLTPLKRTHREKRGGFKKKRDCNPEQINSIQNQLHNLLLEMGRITYQLNELKSTNSRSSESRPQQQFIPPQKVGEQEGNPPVGRGLSAETLHTSQQVFLPQPQQNFPSYPICFFGPNQPAMMVPINHQSQSTWQQQPQQISQSSFWQQPISQPQSFYYSNLVPTQNRMSKDNNGQSPITCMYLGPPPSSFGRSEGTEITKPKVEITTLEPYIRNVSSESKKQNESEMWSDDINDEDNANTFLNTTTQKSEAALFKSRIFGDTVNKFGSNMMSKMKSVYSSTHKTSAAFMKPSKKYESSLLETARSAANQRVNQGKNLSLVF